MAASGRRSGVKGPAQSVGLLSGANPTSLTCKVSLLRLLEFDFASGSMCAFIRKVLAPAEVLRSQVDKVLFVI